jgi:putative addiction module killer protein
MHPPAAAKVTAAIIRMEQGNFSNVKAVGPGVFEYKIDFSPGYRIYFGKTDGDRLIILLGGGTKKNSRGISTLQPQDAITNEEKDKELSKWL